MEDKKGKHVLVIDDDELLLEALKKKLEDTGYKVTICSNVQDAYFKVSSLKPDLIMLDIMMPDISGIDFMNLLNSQLMVQNTPIILMSSLPKKELYEMGYKLGATQYLSKPFDVNAVPEVLEEVFA